MRCLLCLALVVVLQVSIFAQKADPPAPEKIADVQELSHKIASSVEGRIVNGNFRQILEAVGPVLTHIDGVASSTLWICHSGTGRPEAVLAISSWQDKRFIEACSFSEHSLAFDILEAKWTPAPQTRIPLEDAPQPLETEAGRLEQMQGLLKRFGGSEKYLKGEVEFKIQPEPIYRYPKSSPTNDGALFALVRDGDPEAILALETSKDGWQYSIARMTANPMSYSLDGKQFPLELTRNASGPYIFLRRPADQ